MQNIAKVVIGAGYGDEGKGLITDYLCAKHSADVVVRFNGGAQAGHTVETPAGERHVFGHIAAGDFSGAATYLSKYFIVNPMAFFKELGYLEAVNGLRVRPEVIVDPRALVTTPYDMIINQMVEEKRGIHRHGSCGLGIGETIERCTDSKRWTSFFTLSNPDVLKKQLEYIRDVWYPYRCDLLGLDPAQGYHVVKNQTIMNNFIDDALEMYHMCTMEETGVLYDANQVIFEGAQGLLLDQDYGAFPHVTRSNTGLKNVIEIINDLYAELELDVTYVTRAYTTRHGAGPLDHELIGLPYKNVVDHTNVPNKYQGSLRFAYLDVDVIRDAIARDLKYATEYIAVNAGLAITCLDQIDDELKYYHQGKLHTFRSDAYGDAGDIINMHVGLKGTLYKSFGPTRSTVIERA